MMREIKFRAWHKLIKKMINVYVLDQTVYWDENDTKRIKNNSRGWSDKNTQITFTLDEVELMQYTGLKDKNNVEIYEGDILKVHLEEVDYTEYNEYPTDDRDRFFAEKDLFGEIKIRICGGVGMIIRKVDCKDDDIDKHPLLSKFMRIKKDDEVIGNIYSNPELLNKT